MTSIPTEYNGVLYRSKLEAKWAAYFDLCGARFEYEPQAFDLGEGVKYLPDFCVRDVLSVHGGCGCQTIENSSKYGEFWFECKGVMSDYDAKKTGKFRHELVKTMGLNDDGGIIEREVCPFYVLDRSPLGMFNSFDEWDGDMFEFGPIDGDDDYGFVIGKPFDRNGIGLFGADSNYLCLMDGSSYNYAAQVERMFRWKPNRNR